ncbi:MAG: metallophosphoesterase, partial [Bacilli bacterium]|nr:metallophosphoesterase [Bacilli bacterium]
TINSTKITDGFNGFKIVHFSDLLLGSSQTLNSTKKIIKEINNMEADIIIFTGDLISQNYQLKEEDKEKLKEYLKSLNCSLYKYAVIGDNDQANISLYKEIMSDSDFEILDNESTYLFYKDINPIEIVGITDNYNLNQIINSEEGITPSYRILLTHKPDTIVNYNHEDIDLFLAGHSLGGQVRLPFIGGIMKKEGAMTFIDKHYNQNGIEAFISNGLGTEGYGFRTFNTPSITKYRLNKEK